MFAEGILKALSLPPGGQETPISPSEVSQSLAGRVRTVIDSAAGWFGPNQPLVPVAPPDTLPRAFDYPFGSNLYFQPRQEQPGRPSFDQLRALADNYDILRLCIETRKQQILEMPWLIRVVPEPGESTNASKSRTAEDPRVAELTKFLRRPDREHCFQDWLKMALEDVFVIDALSIWLPRDNSGKVIAWRLIDGATIKPLHDVLGWRPVPPNPAYQQVVKGMPAVNLTTDQLIYAPANPRTQMFYGYSPVEQIIMTVNIALRRQMSQLAYYTAGNIPEMIVQVPATWQTDQIKQFQAWFDTLQGDLDAKRSVRFLPESKGITTTKDAMLKDEYDEWLARVCCYCMSVSPTPFVKQVNRATAQTAQETSVEEGKLPQLNWLADQINYIIQVSMGYGLDIEFAWNTEAEVDRDKQSQIDDRDIRNGSRSIDEVRQARGEEPWGVGPFILLPSGPIMIDDIIAGKYSADQVRAIATAAAGAGDDNGSDDDAEQKLERALMLVKAGRKKKLAMRY